MRKEVNKTDSVSKEYLTMKQADYIYRKVELGSLINKNTMKEEIDQDVELGKMDDNSCDEIPYRELIVNNTGRSNVIQYAQYSKNPQKHPSNVS